MVRMLVAALLFSVCIPLGAKSKASGPKPVLIYSMDNCPACESLASKLSGSGTRLRVVNSASVKVSSFPTVVYSDGKRDSGRRIRNGLCDLPSSLRVIKWSGDYMN